MKLAFQICCFVFLSAPAAFAWEALPESVDIDASQEMVTLGKALFFEPRLSLTGTISCNTCHNIMEGGDDGRDTSMGIHGLTGARNSPTVWNSVFQASQFWDGRSDSLEDQAKGPLIAAPEMGMPDHNKAIERIAVIPGYQIAFKNVFAEDQAVTIENAVKAIAAFERTLITPNGPFDLYLKGDTSALNESQIRGMELFDSVGCTECHSGPAFNGFEIGDTEPSFQEFPLFTEHESVVKYDLLADLGRFEVTQDELDKHAYKVPTLRNITLTAPYMHNGRVPTLREAIVVMVETQLDSEISDAEVSDIESFFTALEGRFPRITLPRLPSRSGHSVIDNFSASNAEE